MKRLLPLLGAAALLFAACTPPAPLTTTVGSFEVYDGGVAVARVVGASAFAQLNASFTGMDLTPLTADVISTFGDRFDWIVFVMNEGWGETSLTFSGQYWTARNAVVGTGVPTFDDTASFGSSGVLQGATVLTGRDAVRQGPILHELLHQFANHGAIPTTSNVHWGFSSVGGQLGGWDPATFQDLGSGHYIGKAPGKTYGFGEWANGGNSLPYAPLELYLMGFLPASGVPDVDFADVSASPTWVDQNTGEFTATSITTNTIAQIQSRLGGARSPDSTASQKSFSVIVVMLSAAEPTGDQWLTFSNDISWFTNPADDGDSSLYNFWEATGGVATISVPTLLP